LGRKNAKGILGWAAGEKEEEEEEEEAMGELVPPMPRRISASSLSDASSSSLGETTLMAGLLLVSPATGGGRLEPCKLARMLTISLSSVPFWTALGNSDFVGEGSCEDGCVAGGVLRPRFTNDEGRGAQEGSMVDRCCLGC